MEIPYILRRECGEEKGKSEKDVILDKKKKKKIFIFIEEIECNYDYNLNHLTIIEKI